MPEKAVPVKKLTDKNTKQEMLAAYQALSKQFEEKRQVELNPERKLEEKKVREAINAATAVAADGIDREIGDLKSQIGKMLGDLSEKLATEAARFRSLKIAAEAKESELLELYGIEKVATSLAALIEAQNQKRCDFEAEAETQREELQREIDETRLAWQKEHQAHEAEVRERDAGEKKTRDREKEQFQYAFKREQQSLRDKFNDEKSSLEKELQMKKETLEKEFSERERVLVESETELNTLRTKASAFLKELEDAVGKAVKEATDRLKVDAKNREELVRKEFEGERNVLTTRVESLDKTVKDLSEHNSRLSKQHEAAYQKVQDIAEKTIESAGHAKSLAELQKMLVEQGRKTAAEK